MVSVNSHYNTGIERTSGLNQGKNVERSGVNKSGASIFSGRTSGTSGVDGDSFSSSSAGTVAQIQAQIDELEQQKTDNLAEIDRLNEEIERLTKEADDKKKLAEQKSKDAKQKLKDADKLEKQVKENQKKTQKEYESNAKNAAKTEIEKYKNANKNGEGMTEEELSQNISNAIGNIPGLNNEQSLSNEAKNLREDAGILQDESKDLLLEEKDLRNQIKNDKAKVTDLETENTEIDAELEILQEELEAAKQAQQAQSSASNCSHTSSGSSSGDPIGFEYDGETYDFIRDDGDLSVDDFLGYDKQWEEMKELDTNGDGKVDVNEFKEGNIKLTNSKGNVQDIEKLFGKDFSVDLNSYDKNGQYDIDTNDDDGDGIANQTLLGTFNLNINGQTVNGYNTLDDTDWLKNKFGISSSSSKSVKNTFDLNKAENNNKIKMKNELSQETDANIEKTKNEMEKFKNSLISNPFNTTGENEVKQPKENENEQKNKSLFGFFIK